MKYLFVVIVICFIGCADKSQTDSTPRLLCGTCGKVIYDGEFTRDRNGCYWPVGEPNYCKSWDIKCESKIFDDRGRKYQWGYQQGRKDAIELRYKQTIWEPEAHPKYLEGYNKGYDEVQNVRGGKVN